MVIRPLPILAVVLAWLAGTPHALAYCRTHTDDPAQSTCPEMCENSGSPLAWATSELSYGFNERGFPGLTDAQLRATFASSFQAWENVSCDGRAIGLHVTQLAGTTPLEQGPKEKEPNENVIVHYDVAGWAAQDYPTRAFAITAVWFCPSGAKTCTAGRIFGADIGFNGGMGEYGDCALNRCSSAGPSTDLQNVATHEIGHFLGLSHSDVGGSTMYCDAQAADTDKRSLAADDIAGICATYPLKASSHETRCSASPGGPPSLGMLSMVGALLGLFCVRRRTGRRPR